MTFRHDKECQKVNADLKYYLTYIMNETITSKMFEKLKSNNINFVLKNTVDIFNSMEDSEKEFLNLLTWVTDSQVTQKSIWL